MTRESTFVCTLDPADQRERAAEFADLGGTLAAVTLRFPPGAETVARVEAFVAAESRCCPFLEFELERGDQPVLTITAPPGAEEVLRGLASGP